MLSEPRTQMRGSSELLAAMFGGIALLLYEIGSRWCVVSFALKCSLGWHRLDSCGLQMPNLTQD